MKFKLSLIHLYSFNNLIHWKVCTLPYFGWSAIHCNKCASYEMYILCTVIFSMWWMSIYKYIIARQTLFTTQKHYLLWCPKRCISKTSSWKIWGWNDHAWHLVNGAHMVLTSSESFFNHRNIKLATRFGTKCPQWELQLMMQLNWDRLGSQIPVTSLLRCSAWGLM